MVSLKQISDHNSKLTKIDSIKKKKKGRYILSLILILILFLILTWFCHLMG